MSARAHRMNCLPRSSEKPPATKVAASRANGDPGPLDGAILEINAPRVLHLAVRVSSEIKARRKLNPSRGLDDDIFPNQKIPDGSESIDRRRFRKLDARPSTNPR